MHIARTPGSPRAYVHIVLIAAFTLCMPAFTAAAEEIRLPSATYPDAVFLMQNGEYEKALSTLDAALAGNDSQPVEAMILRAHLLEKLGSYEESEALWNGIAARDRSLRGHAARVVLGLRLIRSDPAGAEAALGKIPGGTRNRRNISFILRVADGYLGTGNNDKAIELYRAVLRLRKSGGGADEARLGIGHARLDAGQHERALAALRELQTNFRDAELFIRGKKTEHFIASIRGTVPGPFSEDQYLRMIQRLKTVATYDVAVEVHDEWSTHYPKSKRADRFDAELIDVLYRMRANEEAIAHCLVFHENHPDSTLAPSIRFQELLLYQRTGRTEELKILGAALRKGQHGGRTGMRRNAGLVLGSYLVSTGEGGDGLEHYRQVYRSGPGNSTKSDILWRVGVGAFRDGQTERSASNLRLLMQRGMSGERLPATIYWLARAEAELGNRTEAARHLIRLEQQFPFHYYGIRAGYLLPTALKKLGTDWIASTRARYRPKKLEFPDLELSRNVRSQSSYRAATSLARAGLPEDAAYYADQLLRTMRGDRAVALLAARAHNDGGNYRRATRILYDYFRAFLQRRVDNLPSDFWQIYYPRSYFETVKQHAARYDIDPYLMLSLMRQESRYDPEARSLVGAVGLFQIMPYTAAEIGPNIGLGAPDDTALTRPEINAPIAAYHLNDNLRHFGSARAPTLASYNTDLERVDAWWRSAQAEELPEDLFVDTIPYRETRRFVRAVLENLYTYQRVYGSENSTSDE